MPCIIQENKLREIKITQVQVLLQVVVSIQPTKSRQLVEIRTYVVDLFQNGRGKEALG